MPPRATAYVVGLAACLGAELLVASAVRARRALPPFRTGARRPRAS